MKYTTSDFRNGLKVEIDGEPFAITWFQFVKPGKGNAFTRTKLKSLLTGNVIERTWRSGEGIEAADISEVTMQYQYSDGEHYYFMNLETYDQVGVHRDVLQGAGRFLTDAIEVQVLLHDDRPIAVNLPNFIEAEIASCEPGVRGNTATGATKTATLSTGAEIQVPLFLEQGNVVRVDTRTGQYVSRVGK